MSKYDWNVEKLKEIVPHCVTISEVLKEMKIPFQGNNGKTLKNILDNNNIDYSHFTGRARIYKKPSVRDIDDYLSGKQSIQTSKLKSKLFKEGLKEEKCECCGLYEWQGKKLVLQLHHKDGNNTNNSLENLQILCPNCHSQTESYCGLANKKKHYYCPDCGKEINKESKYCPVCANKHRRKCELPNKKLLESLIKEHKSFVAVSRLYNVTDSSIRKWCKKLGLSIYIKDYI